jgi:hypothetical protein
MAIGFFTSDEALSDRARRRKLAEAMMVEGMDSSPIQHWTQGANRLAKALLGGYQVGQGRQEDDAWQKEYRQGQIEALGRAGGLPTATTPTAPATTESPTRIGPQTDAAPSGGPSPNYGFDMTAKLETGAPGPARQDAIYPDAGGSRSYGSLGLNSKSGSVAAFAKANPNLGLTAQPGTPEFDAQWRSAVERFPKFMHAAQQDWRDQNVVEPARAKIGAVNPALAGDPRVVNYLADRRVQMGDVGWNSAAALAKGASDPEAYMRSVSESDKQNLANYFRTYLATNPNNMRGLENRVSNRLAMALGTPMGAAGASDASPPMAYSAAGPTKVASLPPFAPEGPSPLMGMDSAALSTSPMAAGVPRGPQQPAPQPPAQPVQMAQAGPQVSPEMRADIIRRLQSNNPYVVRQAEQEIALIRQKALEQQFQSKPTDEMREYELYSQQEKAAGRQPSSFVDYKTNLKKAGAIQNTVQIDQKGETEFSKEGGKLAAKRYDEIVSDAGRTKQLLSDVQTLGELGKNIRTGKNAEFRAAIGPWADALGIKMDSLDDIQAFEAITARVAPSLRVPGSGAQSDMELRNFLKSLPALGNTPEGNALVQKTMEGMAQNKLAAAEIASRALSGDITRKEADKLLRELPDPMAEWREANKKTQPAATPATSSEGGGWKTLPNGVRIREKQ